MKNINKPLIFMLLLFLIIFLFLSKFSAPSFREKLEISSVPKGIFLNNFYFSGFGMDHHYLWEISSDSPDKIILFLQKINATKISKRSMANCLSLSESQSPSWWPANEIEDALWDYTDAKYALYRVPKNHGTTCIFLHEDLRLAFVQWFDI